MAAGASAPSADGGDVAALAAEVGDAAHHLSELAEAAMGHIGCTRNVADFLVQKAAELTPNWVDVDRPERLLALRALHDFLMEQRERDAATRRSLEN